MFTNLQELTFHGGNYLDGFGSGTYVVYAQDIGSLHQRDGIDDTCTVQGVFWSASQ